MSVIVYLTAAVQLCCGKAGSQRLRPEALLLCLGPCPGDAQVKAGDADDGDPRAVFTWLNLPEVGGGSADDTPNNNTFQQVLYLGGDKAGFIDHYYLQVSSLKVGESVQPQRESQSLPPAGLEPQGGSGEREGERETERVGVAVV